MGKKKVELLPHLKGVVDDDSEPNTNNPPPYGVLTLDLEGDYVEEFMGFYKIKAMKKAIDDLLPTLTNGEVLFVVDIRSVIIPPESNDLIEEGDYDDLTIMEKAVLEEGKCPECQDDLIWDTEENLWVCPTCSVYYEPKHVGIQPPVTAIASNLE